MDQDRIYVDKARADEIRAIKGKSYFDYDNQKDVFMCALALGIDAYRKGETLGSKDALFNDRDLNEMDKAMIYAIVNPYLESIDQITDKNTVFGIAEAIADKGFTELIEDMSAGSVEVFLMKALNNTNELYLDAKEDGLLEY